MNQRRSRTALRRVNAQMTSTLVPTRLHSGEDSSEEEEEEDEEGRSSLQVVVPVVLTVVMVALVCFVTVYAKTRRRRRREQNRSDPMTTVSGGVAMNVNVYRNYGAYVNTLQQNIQPGTRPPSSHEVCSIPYSAEAPPSYDDIIKESAPIPSPCVDGTSLTIGTNDQEPPPSYDAGYSSASTPNHSSYNNLSFVPDSDEPNEDDSSRSISNPVTSQSNTDLQE